LIAQDFSPRYERHRDDLVSIDVSGLERLLGPARVIGEELRRAAAARGVRVHVAVAATRMAALVLALARPGVTVVEPGGEADALARIPIGILERIDDITNSVGAEVARPAGADVRGRRKGRPSDPDVSTLKRWAVKTLGELAALPSADLAARLGQQGLSWQAIARGDDVRPLVPTRDEERFESSLDLEWPIEGLEPLSFVLTRLLEPLCTRLERRDRGAAVLYVVLRLVTKEPHACRLELPSPIRDVRTLRTLALLDLESHPPAAAIDRVTVAIDPTPGRVLQHTLFTRAHPTPEQLSTLIARLGALMGQDRLGAPATVDSYRPGAFAMTPYATDREPDNNDARRTRRTRGEDAMTDSAGSACSALEVQRPGPHTPIVSALRRCRHPVPARVAVVDGRPVRVTTDRRGFAGGAVVKCAGPWRTSGEWWAGRPDQAYPAHQACWRRDEWDVALSDGAVYRIFQDHDTEGWFIDAIVD
jgi:protein ImuB